MVSRVAEVPGNDVCNILIYIPKYFRCLNSRRPQDLRTLDARGDGRAHGKLVFVNKRPHKEKVHYFVSLLTSSCVLRIVSDLFFVYSQ